MNRKETAGFTLVEIMIVVAIIGIVVAIAVPAFLRARENARGRACQENLAKIFGAKEQYALEFKIAYNGPCDMTDLLQPDGVAVGKGYLKATPLCPAGGTYTCNDIDQDPTCDYAADPDFEQHVLLATEAD